MYNNHLFTLRSFANTEESHYQTSLKKKITLGNAQFSHMKATMRTPTEEN